MFSWRASLGVSGVYDRVAQAVQALATANSIRLRLSRLGVLPDLADPLSPGLAVELARGIEPRQFAVVPNPSA